MYKFEKSIKDYNQMSIKLVIKTLSMAL